MTDSPEASFVGRTILLTGATGFLGSHLVEALVGRGARVRAIVRPTSDVHALIPKGVEIHATGFSDVAAMTEAVRGVDGVVHAAGGGKVGSVEDFYRANRDTTARLLEAVLAGAPDLRRFVLVSSAAAHGPAQPGHPATEDDPDEPRSHYGKSKLAAEALVLEAKDDIDVTIVRPPAVYGPRDTRMVGLFRAVSKGLLPKIGDGMTSLIYGADCVDALLKTLARPHPSGRRYFVADGDAYSHDRIGRAIEAALNTSALRLNIPSWLLRSMGGAAELWGKATGMTVALTRDKVTDLLQPSWVVSSALARSELGFEPEIRFEEGARLTARWYLEHRWLR